MVGKFHVSVVLLFVRFALCQSCDCKLVDILKNIVQKEMIEREILASRVDMLESLLGSGTRNIASSSIMSSEAVILERLGVLETTTENIKTQLKEITTERQKGAQLNSALIEAWKVHKLGFSGLTEDIKQSSSDNNKSFHNLLADFDKNMRLFEFKFDGLLNKSNNETTKQQLAMELQFDTIRSDLNTTFNDYKSRMDTDIMVFVNKTEKQLYDIRAEIITNECASNPCMNGATCLDGVQRYSCICMDGYNGTNCQTEIDECASNPCKNGATCVDAIDGYSCSCQSGYLYAGNSCQIQIDECSSNPCENGATCVDGLNNYSCRCVAGYSGLNCQINIDECSSNPCMNGATCVDGLDNYSCRCVAGYSGLHCQIDINECSSSPCKNGATCVDGVGSYSCRCKAGYDGFNCQTAECNGACTYAVYGFRLCNGGGVGVCNRMKGRLEVYYNNAWGTLCDDDWDANYYSVTAQLNVNVACRMFGYSSGYTRPGAFFGSGVGSIWLDEIRCDGSEQSLLDCYHTEWGSHNCRHSEDTGVVCTD